jgi:hypothetical protein
MAIPNPGRPSGSLIGPADLTPGSVARSRKTAARTWGAIGSHLSSCM